jgi:hypothetical protein
LGRFGSRAANVKFYHCSIGRGLPVGGVRGGVIVGIVKEGVKEVAVAEWVSCGRGGGILIETLGRANGNLKRVDVLLVHFCLEKSKCLKVVREKVGRTFLFPDWKANWAI